MPRLAESGGGRYQILLSGSGGQGLVLAATVLAEAAAESGKEVVQTQSYGPEARGGASRAEVIISDTEIDYPQVETADLTLCLSQQAFDKYAPGAPAGTVVLYDTALVLPGRSLHAELVGLPFAETAQREAGTSLAANVVALGVIVQLLPLAPSDALVGSLRRRLPAGLIERNMAAFGAGSALAQNRRDC